MQKKLYSHKVTLNEQRRDTKKATDMLNKTDNKGACRDVFDMYYRDQVRALYRAVSRGK